MIINGQTLADMRVISPMVQQKIYDSGVSFGLGEAGYDICIKQEVYFSRDLFLRMSATVRDFQEEDLTYSVRRERGRFALASSVEHFTMPDNLVAIVHDKSSWARRGLSVFNTVIEPGWKGFLTLELVYNGSKDLYIPAGAGIAQIVFHTTSDHRSYKGRYQNQANKPVAAIDSLSQANLL
jgi:dCTP deaminase